MCDNHKKVVANHNLQNLKEYPKRAVAKTIPKRQSGNLETNYSQQRFANKLS